MKQSVQVSILGQQFHLKSDAPPQQVHKIARFVEEQIQLVTASGRAVDTLQAAILALLNVSAAYLGDTKPAGGLEGSVDHDVTHLIAKIEAALNS